MNEIESMHTDLLRCCGRLALESSLFPLAFEMLTRALDREPTDSNTLLMLSKAYLLSGDAASVIRMLVNAINTGVSTIASDSRVWTVLALCYDQLDGFEDSLHAVTQALLLESYHTVDPDLHVMQCRFFLKQGTHHYPLDALLPYFDKMLESVRMSGSTPNVHVEALVSRAQLLYKYSEFEKALIDLETAMALLNSKPEYFKVGERLAKISYTSLLASTLQFLANRPTNSLKLVEDAISSYPHTAKSVQPLILASGMMNSILEKDLASTLDRMVLEEPYSAKGSSFLMNYIIARILLQLDPVHNVYGAYGYYQRALNLNISKPYTWISIGSLYLRLGQINDALSAYTQGSVLALESSQAAEQTSNANSKFLINFNHLFGALAWFGIAQTYIFSRDLASAVEALSRSAQLFAKANNPQQVDELQRQIQTLSLYLNNPVNTVNVEYTIPDIPFQLLLDLLLYHDSDAFAVKDRIEKSQRDSISRATTAYGATPTPSPANSFVKVEENGSNILNSKKLSRPNSSNKVEKRKNSVGNRSRKNSTSVFKSASFSSSNRSPLLNGTGNLATTTTTSTSATAPTPITLEAHVSKSSRNSPNLVPSQQRLTPLLPKNNFPHQYGEYAKPETVLNQQSHQSHHMASPQINSVNTYYPQVIPGMGSTPYQPSQSNAPLVYQNVLAPSRQMGSYVYYP
ncbi:hypothetical protein ZYGR_0AD02840 [Zygosaccharomyces rouxii]|uniref:ZYRO0G12562p n=2 Tax=Zygosaccharomyces rouxii TaxID=4956 RepID=C5E0G7_ZYGRC|nr:uncharacterized protein ZYRO0G12562g [Zygosaccharomyces rouxii]KAH9202594.1 hypothetical protein LQ764DRAFT_174620 [Zygosaccharomyces rouxii]GAV51101.1 hypothetical protein ZYGR_0AD02840 [Zygosaccharomyces rouxii]CAR29601.1 ZYRO0G12562p [Zygosaccharomyces rouxii]